MTKTFTDNQSISELSKKILFTIGILIVCRIGSYIPIIGINVDAIEEITRSNQSGVLGMLNMLSGGSLGRMSIFALAIMPYITASIIMQLLTMAYPKFEEMKKEGEVGRRQLNQYSRYLTVILAGFQGYGIMSGLLKMSSSYGSVILLPGFMFKIITVITLVVGTMLLMWLGEQITSRGIGNGSSMIIFAGIVSGLPSNVISLFEMARKGAVPLGVSLSVPLMTIVLIVIVVFVEQSFRKVNIQYPKKQFMGRGAAQNNEGSYIPLKLNTAGVIPPIFASSILLFPLTITNLMSSDSPIVEFINYHLSHGKPLFILLYCIITVFFCFFYTAVVFNTKDTADNLKKSGAYISGRRPGESTSLYLDYVLTRITVIGAIYLCLVCLLPELLLSKASYFFSLGGTSMLIIVNVILDTFGQIQSFMFEKRYKNLMKRIKIK